MLTDPTRDGGDGVRKSVPAVLATAGAGLVHAHLGQLRQQRLELLPDPAAEVLAGGVFQAGNVVQVVVVELIVDRFEDLLDLREVSNPAGMRVDLTLDVDGGPERVAVQAAALVPGGHVGQAVGGFEGELFEQFQWCAFRSGKRGLQEIAGGGRAARDADRSAATPFGFWQGQGNRNCVDSILFSGISLAYPTIARRFF